MCLKWWWRSASEHDSLWKRLICSKYNFQGGAWLPNLSSSTTFSKIWGGIIAAVEHQQSLLEFYVSNLQLKVGNGSRIKFWSDQWCGALCLKEEFPRIFQLSNDKEGLLKDFVDVCSNNWLFSFRRSLFDWEKEKLLRLIGIIAPTPTLNLLAQDSASWLAAKPGQTLVSVLYNHSNLAYGGNVSSYSLVWLKYLPPKVQFFSWLAWKQKVKTSVFLQ